MAIKDTKHARQARNIGIAWTVIAYIGALALGWIGIAVFGPETLADQEHVMPALLLKIFPPAIAAVLISGAIAAMISTADSLLILSASELSENLVKPAYKLWSKKKGKTDTQDPANIRTALKHSRIVTAALAFIALGFAYIMPSDLIFSRVSFVWAGIGGTFSIIILFTLFWKRFHGKAVLATIGVGVIFTLVWLLTDMEAVITSRIMTFFVAGITAIIATFLFKKKAPGNSPSE